MSSIHRDTADYSRSTLDAAISFNFAATLIFYSAASHFLLSNIGRTPGLSPCVCSLVIIQVKSIRRINPNLSGVYNTRAVFSFFHFSFFFFFFVFKPPRQDAVIRDDRRPA